ncbi:hypothetical protein Pint_12226 [Pistacia integerrima]|uniref:Uncharacterized protein n=1 Tax=Pistacia integerrima TaxID=434235 RepID=A0ACC0XKV4_9ROSI|nr:hypothetical protein Pint_12226 [Pistacia integerrima]
MAMARSGVFKMALRGGSRTSAAPPKRGFASLGHHDDASVTICRFATRGFHGVAEKPSMALSFAVVLSRGKVLALCSLSLLFR